MKRSALFHVTPAVIFAALAMTLPSRPSLAAEPAAPVVEEDRAAQLYKQGHDLYDQGKPADAEKAYQAAWDIRQSFDVAANLGNVELVLGQVRDAAEHLAYALKTFPLGGGAEKRALLQKRFDEARAQVGAIKITITIEGATPVVDGKALQGPLPEEIFVEPGDHTCDATKVGFQGAPQKVRVEKGGSGAARVTMTPVDGGDGGTSKKSVPILVGGLVIGVAGVGAGVGMLAAAGSKGSTADGLLAEIKPTGPCPNAVAGTKCDDLKSARQSGDTLHNIGVPVLIVGGVALVGTAIYALVPAGKKGPKASSFRATPAVSAQGGGFWVSGAF